MTTILDLVLPSLRQSTPDDSPVNLLLDEIDRVNGLTSFDRRFDEEQEQQEGDGVASSSSITTTTSSSSSSSSSLYNPILHRREKIDVTTHQSFLNDLTSYSVDRLTKEPMKLRGDIEEIQNELEGLSFRNYKAFINTSACISDVASEVHKVDKSLNSLIETLPTLEQNCERFVEAAETIATRRRTTKLTLHYHQQLMEILEIPLLMDAFVKNECYDEALELEAFVVKLKRLHNDLEIVGDIGDEVAKCTNVMEEQLLGRLRGKIQLNDCVQVITFLRRLDRYTERELKLKFLQSRDASLQSELDSIPMDNANLYLSNLTSVYKSHLQTIVRNFTTIFGESSSGSSTSVGIIQNGSILYSWVTHRVSNYLFALDSLLRQLTQGNQIANQLEKAMNFGMAMGRVGVDFRSLLVPCFERSIFHLFASNATNATVRFVEGMTFSAFTPLSKDLSTFQGLGSSENQAPIELLRFRNLSHFTNDLINVLNEIRLCAPISLCDQMSSHLHDALTYIANAVKMFGEDNRERMDERQKSNFKEFCVLFRDQFLPFLSRCFNLIFNVNDGGNGTVKGRGLEIESIVHIVSEAAGEKAEQGEDDELEGLLEELGLNKEGEEEEEKDEEKEEEKEEDNKANELV
eukprot:TRINITY_DN1376_c0_g2_i1.p1 TRINITY_DN1376_c0_g2~~TRINITY_DN1376_c0_g2_i1.p1  ORF type:complete len:671 (+),score=199.71 TRINITY_DN1376_c0_g2_i1:116-2014(+)